jgi:hypothetical protein
VGTEALFWRCRSCSSRSACRSVNVTVVAPVPPTADEVTGKGVVDTCRGGGADPGLSVMAVLCRGTAELEGVGMRPVRLVLLTVCSMAVSANGGTTTVVAVVAVTELPFLTPVFDVGKVAR